MARRADRRAVPRASAPRHRAVRHQRPQRRAPRGRIPLRRLRPATLRITGEVRQRHGLAELLPADRRRGGDTRRPHPPDEADRGPLLALRRPPRPCLSRRPQAHRHALLHERRSPQIRTEGLIHAARGSGNGRAIAYPCTKSTPMRRAASRAALSSTCSAITLKLSVRANLIMAVTIAWLTESR